MKYFLLAILLMISSCKEKAILKERNGNIFMTTTGAKIGNYEVVDHKVGTGLGRSVSLGLRIKVEFPNVEMEDLEKIAANFNADSWLVEVISSNTISDMAIGKMAVPLFSGVRSGSGSMRTGKQLQAAFFQIVYSAFYISKRFQSFACPAFGHNKEIASVKIEERSVTGDDIILLKGATDKVLGKVEAPGFKPTAFNGGHSLVGSYTVRVALYNIEKKERLSSYIDYPERVIVKQETDKNLPGCEYFEVPAKTTEDPSINQFKFGR